jgi:suppressor of ftsI
MKWVLAATLAVVALALGTLAQTGAPAHANAAYHGARSATGPCVAPTPPVVNPPVPTSWSPVGGTDALPPASPTPVASATVVLPNPATGVLTVTLTANPPTTLDISRAPLVASPFTTIPPSAGAAASLDGPTLHVSPGGKIDLTFCNELGNYQDANGKMVPLLANIHYHGLHVEPNLKADNIFRTFGPGESKSFVIVPIVQPAGTYWYHVHYHGLSEREVMGGLSGLLIVDPPAPRNTTSPRESYPLPGAWGNLPQQQLTLRDVQTQMNPNTNVVSSSISIFGIPSTRLVDGFYQPTFTMPANRWEIFRLANIGADVFYRISLGPTTAQSGSPATDVPFHVVGEDGLPVWRPRTATELLLAPGKRFDVLVQIPTAGPYALTSLQYAQGAKIVTNPAPAPPTYMPRLLPKAGAETLATLTVLPQAGPLEPAGNIPAQVAPERSPTPGVPEYEQDLAGPHVAIAQKREFVFGYNNSTTNQMQSIINKVPYDATAAQLQQAVADGKPFEHTEAPLADPVVGTVEQWKLVNATLDDHPFHIHINGFQVISVNGRPVHGDGHQDIVNIPKQTPKLDANHKPVIGKDGQLELVNGSVVIRQRFVHFTGWWVFHCHILQHEDNGMMATVEVRANKNVRPTPPPHYVMDGLPKPPGH